MLLNNCFLAIQFSTFFKAFGVGVAVLLLPLISGGCQHSSNVISKENIEKNTPDHIGLLVDMHLVEAALQQIRQGDRDTFANLYYSQIATQYGITKSQLLDKLEVISSNSQGLEKLYQEVVDSINRLEMKLNIE